MYRIIILIIILSGVYFVDKHFDFFSFESEEIEATSDNSLLESFPFLNENERKREEEMELQKLQSLPYKERLLECMNHCIDPEKTPADKCHFTAKVLLKNAIATTLNQETLVQNVPEDCNVHRVIMEQLIGPADFEFDGIDYYGLSAASKGSQVLDRKAPYMRIRYIADLAQDYGFASINAKELMSLENQPLLEDPINPILENLLQNQR